MIASWLKAEPASGQPAVMETAAVFVPKSVVVDYLRGKAGVAQLAEGSPRHRVGRRDQARPDQAEGVG